MHFELFRIGPITVYTYGFMIAVGILSAYFVTEKRAQKMGINTQKFDLLCVWLLIGGFACSKIFYWLTRFGDILNDPSIMLNLADGWVVYGGIIGGLLAGLLWCKKEDLNFLQMADLIIPQVALAQGFGRLGCFFAGCCYGLPTTEWYGITFPAGSLAPAGTPLIPTPLISAAFDFGLFFFLIWLSKKSEYQGDVCAWYLILYSAGRFVLEFVRGDLIRGHAGMFSTSQWISIFMFIAGICMLIVIRKHNDSSKPA